jgi:hypothetical protein
MMASKLSRNISHFDTDFLEIGRKRKKVAILRSLTKGEKGEG